MELMLRLISVLSGKIDRLTILENLIEATVERYKKDECKPSVTCSKLDNGNWYVSICRYEGYGKNKTVVASYKDQSLDIAIAMCSDCWVRTFEKETKLKKAIADYGIGPTPKQRAFLIKYNWPVPETKQQASMEIEKLITRLKELQNFNYE